MTEPIASIVLAIRIRPHQRGRKKLRVFIWKHKKDLRVAAHEHSVESAHFWRTAAGAYVGYMESPQFGEIHLWQKLIGGGYFAHELQHFMNHYSQETENYPLDFEANERMAWLAGDLTNQFWTKFYKRFEVQ
jgi:hypothetical protein